MTQQSPSVCRCGSPVFIRKTGECKRCYHNRYAAERRARHLSGACANCSGGPVVVAKSQLCAACAATRRSRAARSAARTRLRGRPFPAEPNDYQAAHALVRRVRGAASAWQCMDCDARAEQWAYRPDGPHARVTLEPSGGGKTQRRQWSPRPEDYDPLCRRCHGIRDRGEYGTGYRHDREKRRAYAKRWRRKHYVKQTATPEGRQAYRDRKNRERAERRARAQSPSDSLAPVADSFPPRAPGRTQSTGRQS